MKTQAMFLFLFWGVNMVLAQSSPRQEEQFGLGGELQLIPVDAPKPITSITWKHQGNIVAEWIQDLVDRNFLGILKGRAALNLTTGQLTVPVTKKTDEGLFTVEINNKVQRVGFDVREIKPVPEPEVIVRPLTCNDQAEECKLSCEVKSAVEDQIKQAKPVQYFWKQENAQWEQSEKDKNITNNEETRRIKTFSCRIKNKISEKESPPLDNPFNKTSKQGLGGGAVAGIILGGFLGVCGLLGFLFREKIKPYCVNGQASTESNGENKATANYKRAPDTESSKKNES